MPLKVSLIYNEPQQDRYSDMGEAKAELGVMEEVNAVRQALDELNYISTLVPLSPPLEQVKKKIESLEADVIFNLFEGFGGRPETEFEVARMLGKSNIPFTGCPAGALELALDKARAKNLLIKSGIPTPEYQVLNPANISSFHLDFPCIVKPLSEDASHGISEESVVYELASLEKQVKKISNLFGGEALVEEFLEGREFNTTVMGNRRLTIPAISKSSILRKPRRWRCS
jgi:D-alanine-D-alanine ligase